MCRVDVTAADNFFSLGLKGIHLVKEAIVEFQFELDVIVAPSAVGKIYVKEDEIAEISLYDTSLMVEFLHSESEFDAYGIDSRIKGSSGIAFALSRIEPALISGDIRDLRS